MSKKKSFWNLSRQTIRFAVAAGILLSSCGKATISPVVKPDTSEWKATLQECVPTANPEEYVCPRHTLERAYDVLAEQYVEVISCKRDLDEEKALCRVRLSRVEAELDSPWRQWWLWTIIGAAAGAAVATGCFLGAGG